MVNRDELFHLVMENAEILCTLLQSDAATLDKIAGDFDIGSESHKEVAKQTRDIAWRRRNLARKIQAYIDRSKAQGIEKDPDEPFCSLFFEGEFTNGSWHFY